KPSALSPSVPNRSRAHATSVLPSLSLSGVTAKNGIADLEPPLLAGVIQGLVERAGDDLEDLLDLRGLDDEGRRRGEGVAERAQDRAVLLAAALDVETDVERGRERRLGSLILHQLEPAHEADAAHLAHQRMAGKAPQPLLQHGRHLAHVADDVGLL